jgi:putative transposase
MGYRKINFDKVQHIYNRGCDKRTIFIKKEDRLRFINYLIKFNTIKRRDYRSKDLAQSISENLVLIDCFCLMPNHFHICLKQVVEGGISKFMLKVQGAYTNYFNKKYARSGVLFQGEYKNTDIENQNQLEYLRIYIKNNPLSLINTNYDSIELLHGHHKLSKTEKEFIKNYPYSRFFNLF